MGNDGGSIPTRRELVKEAAKALTTTQLKEVQAEQSDYSWSHDPLTSKPLATPIVSDHTGTLYNKDSILEYLLAEPTSVTKIEGDRILDGKVKSLKDVVEVKFKVEGVRERRDASSTGRTERWVCPVTGNEIGVGAGKKSVYLVPCGHAFEASAVEQVAGEPCTECNTAYAANDVIPILSTLPTDVARLSLRMKGLVERGLTHALKKAPGAKKKRKNAELAAETEDKNESSSTTTTTKDTSKSTTPPKPSSSDDEPKTHTTTTTTAVAKPKDTHAKSKPATNPTTAPTGIKNANTAYVTKRVLEEQEERNKRRKLGENDTQKSLFHSRSAKPTQTNSKDYMTRGFSM